mmetsp:Transcript_42787/g.107988  ORF Transcript_42787/g.107988 Transcript_42787/m.107988 type:complete len:109 (-) Transcript_42787:270-596(-)
MPRPASVRQQEGTAAPPPPVRGVRMWKAGARRVAWTPRRLACLRRCARGSSARPRLRCHPAALELQGRRRQGLGRQPAQSPRQGLLQEQSVQMQGRPCPPASARPAVW